MRPLQLIVESFTCFRDKQPPLDLSELELFAITGPTGAGKTSLLDALIFALYGRVPRVGRATTELISLGRDRMSVVLEFQVGTRRFRVTRTGRRGRSGEAHLEEVLGQRQRPISSGIQQVDAEIGSLLGLRYDAFTQAVVLPQGEFARFLRSQPRERREILRDLLRLQIYERMRKVANEQAKELGVRVRGIEERLGEDYVEATEEKLAELVDKAARQEKKNRELSEKLSEEQGELERQRMLHAKSRELADQRRARIKLEEDEPRIEEGAKRLGMARRVGPVVPLLEAYDEQARRVRTEEERARAASDAFETAAAELGRARERLQVVKACAAEIPAVRERIRLLDEIKGLLAPRETARSRLEEAQCKLRELEEEAAHTGRKIREERERFAVLEEKKAHASAALEELGYDREADLRVDSVRDEAVQLGALRREARRALLEARRMERRVSVLESEALRRRGEADEARGALQRQRERAERSDSTLREAEGRHAAAHLRRHLQVGKKCPVCEQRVETLPPPLQFALLDALRSAADEARSAEAEARRVLEEKDRQAAKTSSERDSVRLEAQRFREKAVGIAKSVEEGENKLASVVPGRIEETGESIEEQVLAAAKRLAELRFRHAEAAKRVQDIEKELQEAGRKLDRLVQEEKNLERQIQEHRARIRQEQEELSGYQARISRIAGDSDPVAEAEKLIRRVQELETALREAEEADRSRGADAASAGKAAEEARRSAVEAAERLAKDRRRIAKAVREARFEDEAAARNAVMSDEEQARLDKQIAEFRQERHALDQRIIELESEIGGEVVTDEALERAGRGVERLRSEFEAGLETKAALEQQAKELEKKIRRAAALIEERDRLSRDHFIYRRLADDLRSERFQAYLLEETFRELVRGASERLEKLSGRYSLDYREDAFHVLDHENAGERRSADTLSGGETFLASLSLALELSEQVQRAAGAVNLDSLFIDEGFGTLDPETLDTVAGVIESLPVGGRMVGIITHIPELTERLPACIRVAKSAEGSRLVRD